MEQVRQWVRGHRDQMVLDLIKLVRVPSISEPSEEYPPFGRGCRDVIDTFLTLCGKYGYELHNYDYYVGEATCGEGETSIGIWSHLDVVPAPDPGAWSFPPFECAVVQNRYLIGRGVQDNKMPAIGVLYALNYLRENGIPLRHRYSLFVGTNEENGMADIKYYRRHYRCPTLSLVPDSGFPVCIAERGNCLLRICTPALEGFSGLQIQCEPLPGLAAGLAKAVLPGGETLQAEGETVRLSERNPEQPIATEMLLTQLTGHYTGNEQQALQSLLAVAGDTTGKKLGIFCEDAHSGQLRGSAGKIGVDQNRVFMDVTLTLPVCVNTDTLAQTVEAACNVYGLSTQVIKLRAPHSFPANHPVVERLTQVYRETTGFMGSPFVMSGGSYAGQLPNAFAFGPGMPGRTFPPDIFRPGCGDYHQVDESEDIEHLCMFTEVYIHALLALNEMELFFEGDQA